MTNQNPNTDPIRPDPIEDSDGKDDFTEGKSYIEEVHKMTVKGDLKPMVHYALPKDSALERTIDTLLETIAGTNKAGRIIGEGKDLVKYVIPYGGKIDALTDKVGKLIRNEITTDMSNSKPWYKSLTIKSIIAIIAIGLSQFFDIQVTESEIQKLIEHIGIAIASATAIYGRIRANTKISNKK